MTCEKTNKPHYVYSFGNIVTLIYKLHVFDLRYDASIVKHPLKCYQFIIAEDVHTIVCNLMSSIIIIEHLSF